LQRFRVAKVQRLRVSKAQRCKGAKVQSRVELVFMLNFEPLHLCDLIPFSFATTQ